MADHDVTCNKHMCTLTGFIAYQNEFAAARQMAEAQRAFKVPATPNQQTKDTQNDNA